MAHRLGLPGAILGAVATLGLVPFQARPLAGEDGVWPVENRLQGEPRKKKGGTKTAKDISGIACATAGGFPRLCLVADDSTPGAQVVIVHENRLVAGDYIPLNTDSYEGELLELDAEGVAYADGAFYVIGSHGRPRHNDGGVLDAETAAKARATRQVFRLRLDPAAVGLDGRLTAPAAITRSHALSGFLTAQPALAPSFDGALASDGLNIEGLAVRGDRLYAGLRGPVLPDGRAAILSVPLAALFEGGSGQGELLGADLGRRRGVRDLVAFEGGFLVLAGPVQDPPGGIVAAGDYAVYQWDGADASRRLGDVPAFGTKVKPEALLPLDRDGDRLRLLLLFDGPEQGAPRTVTVAAP